MKMLFNSAYYLARAERPFTDFPGIIQLQKKNGISDIGNTYMNDKQARQFIGYIADNLRDELIHIIRNSELFSLLSHSSTDRSVVEEEIMYVRVLQDCKPKTMYLSLQPVHGKANAQGILHAIENGLQEDGGMVEGTWKDNIVGFGADGVAVMLGKRGGVAALIKRDVPYLQEIHCVAHKLELSIKVSTKNILFMLTVTEFFLAIYKFYHYSPLNWNGLKRSV